MCNNRNLAQAWAGRSSIIKPIHFHCFPVHTTTHFHSTYISFEHVVTQLYYYFQDAYFTIRSLDVLRENHKDTLAYNVGVIIGKFWMAVFMLLS